MLATCFFDMQGFYLVVINTVALSYWNWRHPSILRRYLLEMSAAAAGIHALYRYVFGFWWLSLLNGYEVRGAYHELPWAGLKAVTSVDLFMSAHLFLDYFRFFFGSLSVFWALGAFLLLAGTGGAGLLQKRRDWLLLWGFVGLSLVTMLFLMGVKFDYIYAHHIRRIYYSLPMTALFLVFSAWNLSHFAKRFPKANAAVGLVLVALVFHNLAILPQHKALLDKTGEGSSRNREDILAAMRAIHDPFAPVPESVARNLIYRSLKAAALNQPVPPVEAPDETPTR